LSREAKAREAAKNLVEQIQTAIRGQAPSSEKLNLADFEIKQTESGKPTQITCPQQQTMTVHLGSQKKNYVAHFEAAVCQACPFFQKGVCPAQRGKRDLRFHLHFSQEQANMSQRRRQSLAHHKEGRNLRAAIEATVRQVKHPFPASKMPVRGRFRVTCLLIGSAHVSNVRRIQRCLETKMKVENEPMYPQNGLEGSQEQSTGSFFAWLKAIWDGWNTPMMLRKLCFGC